MEEKKEKILSAALRLFVKNGFHATPTSKIANEARVATGTLFHYFKTKVDLINELYLETKNEMSSALREDVDKQKTVKAKIKKVWYNAINWTMKHTEKYLFFQQYSNSTFIDHLTRERGMEGFDFIAGLIEQGKKEEILKNAPTELMFEMALGSSMGVMNMISRYEEKQLDKKDIEISFVIFWDSMKG